MPDNVITIESLSKRYRLGILVRNPYAGVERLVRRAGNCWARFVRGGGQPADDRGAKLRDDNILWALEDINLAVRQGEVLGIIGSNGAGKSTLLKILARITEPTTGRVTMHGRVASLLEVGTGFHPELTGRDNVYLNGSILGLSLAEIRKRFDAIVDFAGVERFLDTPVKRYSSGMYVRLAFAVAAHLDPEILIVDEVLAVGDLEFQRKCLGKMRTISAGGRTVLFVSHNMAAINHFCTRAVCLRDGRIVHDADPPAVVSRYISDNFIAERVRTYPRVHSKRIQIRQIELQGLPESERGILYRTRPFEIRVTYDVNQPVALAAIKLVLEKPDGATVCQTRDIDCGEIEPGRSEPGTYQTAVRLPGDLLNIGTYTFRASIETAGILEPLDHQDGLTFELHDPDGSTARNSWGRPRQGVLFLDLPWTTERCSGRSEPALSEAEGCQPIRAATVRERITSHGGG